MLESERAVDPDALTIVVAEAGPTVVCAAWVPFERDTEFATLWGGAPCRSGAGAGSRWERVNSTTVSFRPSFGPVPYGDLSGE
jgi:hypothetical protein